MEMPVPNCGPNAAETQLMESRESRAVRCHLAICTAGGCVAPARLLDHNPSAPTNPKSLGEHLKKRRLDSHVLQKDVAKTLNINVETLKNWERGVGIPTVRQLPGIIKFGRRSVR